MEKIVDVRFSVAGAGVLLAGCMLASMTVTMAATDAEPVLAGWKEQEIRFVYLGRTAFYTCHSLEDKVERIFLDLGAREDVVVRSTGCIGPGFGQTIGSNFMNVRIKVAMPTVVVPGTGLEPEEKSRRELVRKVRGEPHVDADELEVAEQFPAEWTSVKFSDRSRYYDDGDCELFEQLAMQVLPKLEIQVVRKGNWCIPGQVQMGQLNVELAALRALPRPDDKPE